IKNTQHSDVVEETLRQFRAGKAPKDVRLDVTIGNLRDRSVNWLVTAHKLINKAEIVKKSFSLCKAGRFDLSFDTLTSADALRTLRDLPRTEPDLWSCIVPRATSVPENNSSILDDAEPFSSEDTEVDDDEVAEGQLIVENGSESDAYEITVEAPGDVPAAVGAGLEEEVEQGRGKRRRTANKQYKEYEGH
ncbi:hypothetical protein BJ138DRAFT_964040, partial [Hygrophoropsis aurantiaca]